MIVARPNPREDWREPNPLAQTPTRFREGPNVHVVDPGRSPGTMEVDRRFDPDTAPGTVRRLWRQVLAGIPGPPPVPVSQLPAEYTRSLRYRAQSFYLPAGTQNSRFSMLHTVIAQRSRQLRPVYSAGTRKARPTVRNRMASFGSRVEPLNRAAPAGQAAKT
jgi:hypothetical protein